MTPSKAILIGALVLMVLYTAPVFMSEVGGGSQTLVLYGFSILEEVMSSGILPAFQAKWKQETGEPIRFYTSFSGSGTVMNQIRFGAPADVAIFAHTLDAYRLKEAGLIRSDWTAEPHQGIVNRTPIVLIVRPGNPKGLQSFDDLRRPGIGIVHPDPQTSGGALWALLAEYGAFALPAGGDRTSAHDGMVDLWKNVIVLGASARAARTQFEMGFGDVLITYEQEAVKDLLRGRFKYGLAVPERTIYSEHPAVVIDRNVTPAKGRLIRAFLDFLWTEEAQRIFVKYGFRSVTDDRLNEENHYFSRVASPFTVADLGGWNRAYSEIVEGLWRKEILEEVHR
ncbi:MAG: substrate-binding domain-containing protein [Nitrospirae bacterium]|nr:substrate-binding domain-containing protein [Candidatus Manganitrophaceae bacterium]